MNLKRKLTYFLKYSRTAFYVYHNVFSFAVRLLGKFIKTDDKLILFNSFGGRKYDDSPKAIYEEMKMDPRFENYRLVWALQDPKKSDYDGEVVRCDTLPFFKTALAAKVWITNSSMERGLKFKKARTLYFNTWHGTAIKKMGADIAETNTSFKASLSKEDIMLAQSQYDVDIFSRVFNIPRERFRIIGLPRNDELVHYSNDRVEAVKKKLGIMNGKKVLLYAPTFREYEKDGNKQVVLNVPIDLKKWQEKLSEEYVVLFRAHYEVAKHMKLDGASMFIDVSTYPVLADLMIVSDALISDYSSISFDYSVMHKPIYCFAYDYDEYVSHRGMYLDLSKELPCLIHRNEDDLIDDILNNDPNRFMQRVVEFQNKYVTENGTAAKKSCDEIAKQLMLKND